MIPADLGAELTAAVRAAVTAAELPAAAARVVPSGTWRLAPAPGRSPAPGPSSRSPDTAAHPEWPPAIAGNAAAMARRYATSLPFVLSRIAGREPREIAARLGQALAGLPWVSSAEVTGAGYLTIEITPAALAAVAVRISQAGPRCACGGAAGDPALLASARELPPLPDPAAAAGWRQAGQAQVAAATARLARAAVTPLPEGSRAPDNDSKREWPAVGSHQPAAGSVASAVSYAGTDAVRYWLTRNPSWPDRGPSPRTLATRDLSHPWYAVTFAQADAAAVRHWAADLGLGRDEAGEPGVPDETGERLAGLLGAPAEIALLGRLSWLGERVAGAARRARPADLAHYLEDLAAAWLDCRETCPALPFGGAAAPREAAGISARLLLADATAAALGAGLALTGAGPDRGGLS